MRFQGLGFRFEGVGFRVQGSPRAKSSRCCFPPCGRTAGNPALVSIVYCLSFVIYGSLFIVYHLLCIVHYLSFVV